MSLQQSFTFPPHVDTLELAREKVRLGLEDGIECPCCGRYCKAYRRKITREMAVFLRRLVSAFRETNDWVHVRDVIRTDTFASTNGTFLTHWNLIHPPPDDADRRAGLWKPTQRGIDFSHGAIAVPRFVILNDNRPTAWAEEHVFIRDCLGEKFDMDEANDVKP